MAREISKREQMVNRRKLLLVAALVALIGVGWLYMTSPTVSLYGTTHSVACRPLAWSGGAGGISPSLPYPSSSEATNEWLDANGGTGPGDRFADPGERTLAQEVLVQACADARQGRQTLTMLVAIAAATLILAGTRPLTAPGRSREIAE